MLRSGGRLQLTVLRRLLSVRLELIFLDSRCATAGLTQCLVLSGEESTQL